MSSQATVQELFRNRHGSFPVLPRPEPSVTGFWIKAYDQFNRLIIHRHHDRDAAYADFRSRMSEGHYFVQMGAWTTEGSIVLNEGRPTANV